MRLKTELILIFGSVVVASALIISIIGYYYMHNQGTTGIENELTTKTQALTSEVNGWLNTQAKVVETVATSLQDDFDEDTFDAKDLAKIINFPANKGTISDLYIGTLSGKFFDGSGWVPDADYDPHDRIWYISALASKKLTYTDIYLDKVTDSYAISVATPITTSSDETVAIIAQDLLLSTLTEKIGAAKFGENGYALMIDSNTLVIAHPNASLQNTKLNENEALSELANTMVTERNGYIEYSYDGDNKIMVFKEVPSTHWIIAITVLKDEVYSEFYAIRNSYIIINIIIALIVIIIAFLVATNISKPILGLTSCAESMAAGNIRAQAKVVGSYEIKQLSTAFNIMSGNIQNLISAINTSANSVITSSIEVKGMASESGRISKEVSKTVNELAQGATDQATSASEGVEAISDMTHLIDEVTDTGKTSETLADRVQTVVDEGYDSVVNQGTLMNENKASTETVKVSIEELDEKTEVIGQIVDVISSIANQTNLLALNAAIEAARAGEHGKGFAVVAEEVRNLAEQSASSSNEIAKLLDDIRTKTKESVKGVMVAKDVVEKQEIALEKMKNDYSMIKKVVQDIVEQAYTMVHVFPKVTAKTEDVSNVISNIATVTEESAAATQEVAAATIEQTRGVEIIVEDASNLVSQAESLMEEIQKFDF